MKQLTILAVAALMLLTQACTKNEKSVNTEDKNAMENPAKTEHFTFKLNDKVTRQKVTFKNRYGITLAADLYLPKNRGTQPLAALAISGPFGAVKEQSS